MKNLIPVAFTLGGAYLIGLPSQTYMQVANLMVAVFERTGDTSILGSFRTPPYIYVFIPWIFGSILIAAALYFAVKSYKE